MVLFSVFMFDHASTLFCEAFLAIDVSLYIQLNPS